MSLHLNIYMQALCRYIFMLERRLLEGQLFRREIVKKDLKYFVSNLCE